MDQSIMQLLPHDYEKACLVGRVEVPSIGPCVVLLKDGKVFDITAKVSTTAELFNMDDPKGFLDELDGLPIISSIEHLLRHSIDGTFPDFPKFIAPVDFQAIKACGVTFVTSMIERVVEERCMGDATKAEEMRRKLESQSGVQLSMIKPGTEHAARFREMAIAQGLWSQYLEVGLGPDAEVFTKSQPMSAVGFGAEVGLHPGSEWNNPEPEVVLIINKDSEIVGATLGNDVNLRDFEGRSALLLGKAKDNNGSCAIGPFIRLFDEEFTLDDVRSAQVSVTVTGTDGFKLQASSDMTQISRDVTDLVGQTFGRTHQYPDGCALFLGTLFAPVQDRDKRGQGFTHKSGDVVEIYSPKLGMLYNRVNYSDRIEPWRFGALELINNLRARQLL